MICAICRTAPANSIRYGNLPYCNPCWDKEVELQAANNTPEKIAERKAAQPAIKSTPVLDNEVVKMSQQIDATIQIRSDVFNAKTTAILDVKAAIDNDVNVTNKPYALAEVLKTKFEHLSSVIFDKNQEIMDATNEQRAIQVYLNNLANTLRAEEREKLKIQDIKYTPSPVKVPGVKSIKTTGVTTKKTPAHKQKIDKEALKKYATELGISEFILQSIVIQKGVTVEKAADILRASIQSAKAAAEQR